MGTTPNLLTGQVPPVPPTPPSPNKKRMVKHLYIGVTAFYLILAGIAGFNTTYGGVQWWALVIVALFCHIVLGSVKIIREQEMAIKIFLGVIVDEWKSGPHFALWPFFYIRRMTKNSIQVDFGTLDSKTIEEVKRARRSENSKSWYVMTEPVRINWGDIKSLDLAPENLTEDERVKYIEAQHKRYANDPYSNTMTTDPHFYFRIRVSNLTNLIEEVGGLDEAIERIKTTCVRALSEEAGKTFVAKARQELGTLSKLILARVEDLVGDPNPNDQTRTRANLGRSWGLDVEEAAIQDIGAPHAANSALAERAATIARADGEATATIRTADANQIKTTKDGQGKAAAMIAVADAEQQRLTKEGEGRASALRALAVQVQQPGGELILKTDALKEVMTASGGKIVVVPSDLSSLTGILTGVAETLKKADPPTQS